MNPYRLFVFVYSIIFVLKIDAQGLIFQNPLSIEKRTSYTVFNHSIPKFHHHLSIDFDMRLPKNEEVGYILRIIDKPSNLIFNVFFDGRGDDFFELNEEGNKRLLRYHYDRAVLNNKLWFHFRLSFDMDRKMITLSVDGNKVCTRKENLPKELAADIVFGRSDYLVDVPAFSMRNLVIASSGSEYEFPLNQTHGTDVYSKSGRKTGMVVNPYWGINDAYHWKHLITISSRSGSGVCYDPQRHNIYDYSRDSLFIYNVITRNLNKMRFKSRCPVDIHLGMNFLDKTDGRLYAYEAYKEGKPEKEIAVASLDLNTYEWTPESNAQINEGPMHQHGGFFDARKRQYTIYGGFAAMRYSNTFYTYVLDGHAWQMRHDMKGKLFPRYYISMGYDNRRYAYIFGGIGNASGDQTVGRKFFYDLHRLDCAKNSVVKLWSVKWKGAENMVPVRGMVIIGDYFYTLCYSEFISDSYLKLYRFSLKDGRYEQLGDSIQIHPDRIETNANIYYDQQQQQFIVTVQEFTKDSASVAKVYSINAPVLSEMEYQKVSEDPHENVFLYVVIITPLLAVILVIYCLRRRKMRRRLSLDAVRSVGAKDQLKPNAVYLFGEFVVHDSKNRDITYMFTDKLKQVLCLMISFSNGDGISSRLLGNLLWGDKTAEKIKNSRSVTINHLRSVLSELDGVKVTYNSNHYKLECEDSFYCDYLRLQQISESGDEDKYEKMLRIVRRGKFLSMLDMPSLDTLKSETERQLMPWLTHLMEESYEHDRYQISLDCAEAIFDIDPFNDKAFNYKIRSLKKMNKIAEYQEAVRTFNNSYFKVFGEKHYSDNHKEEI